MGTQEHVTLIERIIEVNKQYVRKFHAVDIDYDADRDVMYIALGEARPAMTAEICDGLMVRYDPDTLQTVGFTILSFKEYFIGHYPEFCFLLDTAERKREMAPAYSAAAVSRTTSSLMAQCVAV